MIAVRLDTHPADLDMTATRQALRHAGELIRQEWTRLAGTAIGRHTGDYINGLRSADSTIYPYEGDDLAIAIVNNAPHAGIVEWGHPAFNLAQRIRWGQTPKSRKNKRGGWYILIPFRHYVPGGQTPASIKASMPASVHQVAKMLQPGQRLTSDAAAVTAGPHQPVHNAAGKMVGVQSTRQETIQWRALGHTTQTTRPGAALAPSSQHAIAAMTATSRSVDLGNGIKHTVHQGRAKSPGSIAGGLEVARASGGQPPDPFRKSPSIFEGMFKSGAKGHAQYITVRAITPQSSWIIPSQPGNHLAEQAGRNTDPEVWRIVEEGFRLDVERHLNKMLQAQPADP